MGNTRLLSCLACLLLIGAALAGCGSNGGGYGGGGDSTAASSQTVKSVSIEDFIYEPASIVVPKGTKVTFTNHDSSPHTATSSESGVFESGTIKMDQVRSITLDEPGNFAYYCAFHPFMKGKIVVE